MKTINITYIGHRPVYKDGACGSGVTFKQGETLAIPEQYAVRMLKHAAVWVRADDKAKADEAFIEDDTEAKKKDDELNQQHDMRESISHMDKDALKTFAQTQWRISLDGRKSVEALRADVIQKFDQFGSV